MNEQTVMCSLRGEYMKKLGEVVCVDAKRRPFSEIEKKYQRLGYGAYSVMYGLFVLGMALMWEGVVYTGFAVFLFGVAQFFLITLCNELWHMKHYAYAVEELKKDPHATALIAEYSKEDWPVSKDIF